MTGRRFWSVFVVVCCFSSLFAQQRRDARETHYRILAVVPLIGTGTKTDPIRPAYVPTPPQGNEKLDPNGILAFTFLLTDDGKHALVEFVARNPVAFNQIKADTRADVKVFDKGKTKREDIEKEFKKYKKDFDLDRMMVRLP